MVLKIYICVVGWLRLGLECILFDDYLDCFDKIGRVLGFGLVKLYEVEDCKGGGMVVEV